MTNNKIRAIALEQSAIDLNCTPEDLMGTKNKVVVSRAHAKARRYLELPFACNLVSYGTNIVASVQEEYRALVEAYLGKYADFHCFEPPYLYVLNEAFAEHGMRVSLMAEYWLPDTELLSVRDCAYELRVLGQEAFRELYVETWSNALCEKRKQLDVLGVGAYEDGRLIGLAGCSADCDTMWQIGVDVLPEYRRRGIATALTGRLAAETLKRGKVPFYCCAWSNIRSAGNAIKSGFRPAWIELTVRDAAFADAMHEEREGM